MKRFIQRLKLVFNYGPELDQVLVDKRKDMKQKEFEDKRNRLALCYWHQAASPGSHYAEHNCDYCKALKKLEMADQLLDAYKATEAKMSEALPPEASDDQWQSLDTAPLDGTVVQGWTEDNRWVPTCRFLRSKNDLSNKAGYWCEKSGVTWPKLHNPLVMWKPVPTTESVRGTKRICQ